MPTDLSATQVTPKAQRKKSEWGQKDAKSQRPRVLESAKGFQQIRILDVLAKDSGSLPRTNFGQLTTA